MTFKRCCLSMIEVARGFCPRGLPVCVALALVVPLGIAEPALAQETAAEEKLPAPEELQAGELASSDGLQLAATFYPGTKGKDTVPVILLHMWKGSRKDYAGLAPFLQQQGHAVLVPDLRGHGGSTRSPLGGRKLDAAKMGAEHYSYMRYDDMEALRKFLVKKNDQEELNLNKLCIVGAEMGAAVAAYYAYYDWTEVRREANRRPAPSQDVKALVLISPDWDFKGMPMNKPLANPLVRSQISVMVFAGREDSRSLADARRVYNLLKRFHVDPDSAEADQLDLLFGQPPTKLQGTKMLGVRGLNLEREIGLFIELRLLKQAYPWYKRASGD